MIQMFKAAPYSQFEPQSGTIYVADQNGIIPSVAPRDVIDMLSMGCTLLGPDGVLSTEPLLITSVIIKDLAANPFTFVAAPGLGKAFFPVRASIVLDYNSVTYTGSDMPDIFVGDPSDGLNGFMLNFGSTSLWKATESANFGCQYTGATGPMIRTLSENKALVLGQTGTDLADGDSDVTIIIDYKIVTLP